MTLAQVFHRPDILHPQLMPTPDAYAGERGGSQSPEKRRAGGHTVSLSDVVEHELLPTPTASQSGNTAEDHLRKKPGRSKVTDLGILVEAGLLQTGGRLLPTVLASSKGASQAEIEAGNPKHRLETEVLIGGFGKFTAAIERWQQVIGREAPAPTEPTGKDGSPRLSPKFTEWMMGVPAGWITDPEIWGEGYSDSQARNAQLKACGNGVVPQQAMLALRELLGVPRSERANA